jgi:type VI secretion system protein ImpG
MRRLPTNRLDVPGTDIHLSFVDFNFDPLDPPTETIYAKVLCTNRQLAPQIPAGGLLWGEEKLPVDEIQCLKRPTAPIYPPMDGSIQWRLISQLSLNHLSLTGGEKALTSLKELMRLYGSFDQQRVIPELDMLIDLKSETVVRRFGMEAWRGFAEGTKIQLLFDPKESIEGSGFLFAMLLNYALPMFANMTSFTELEISKTTLEEIWKRWKPRSGTRPLL